MTTLRVRHALRVLATAAVLFRIQTGLAEGCSSPMFGEPIPVLLGSGTNTVWSAVVGDFNGDGKEDVVLSQNFFDTEPSIPRLDAGRGLLLLGDGQGGLRAVPGQESGIKVYGEQRGAAAADFNEDGRLDLVITQNGAQTRLLKNTAAKPGLRVRLRGGLSNPHGIGAVVRLKFGSGFGPAREIHCGGGYLSQDSATLVLGTPQAATGIWVRWPAGKVTESELPTGAKEVQVDQDGRLTKTR